MPNPEIRAVAGNFACQIYCDSSVEIDTIGRASESFANSTATLGILPLSEDASFAWTRWPSPIAALSMSLTNRAAVLVKGEPCELEKEFQDVPQPLWDLVIRTTQADEHSVIILDNNELSGDLASVDPSTLPTVAPDWPPRDQKWLVRHLQSFDPGRLSSPAVGIEATALQAGLWQLHDFLEQSHVHSQSIEGEGYSNGDFWHAIMHRREPDYGNSKYWFRRVGTHDCYAQIAQVADSILGNEPSSEADEWRRRLVGPHGWDACSFVDLCQTVARGKSDLENSAKSIQWAEMLYLLDYTYRMAAD